MDLWQFLEVLWFTFFPIFVFIVFVTILFQLLFHFGILKHPFEQRDCFGLKNPELMELRIELLENALERENEKEKGVENNK